MEIEDTTGEDELSGADLVRDLRRQLKSVRKELTDRDVELGELRGASRQASVAAILVAKGINPKVAKFIPSDVDGDANVGAWLDEHAELFGGSAPTPVDGDEVTATKRLQDLSKSATPPSALADLESRLATAKSESEVNDLLMEAKSLIQH